MRRILTVSSLCVTTVLCGLAVPAAAATPVPPACTSFDAGVRTDPVLGYGLTLNMAAAGHLVSSGTAPKVVLTPTTALASGYTVAYTVRNRTKVLLTRVVAAPASPTALPLPSAVPGAYQVEATLRLAGVPVSATCLRYGVAMAGATLAPAALPAGADWGGGGAERAAVLDSSLGLKLVRQQADVATFLSNRNAYDTEWNGAATAATSHRMLLDVQVGQGGAAERAAVAKGTWEGLVRDMVSRQVGVVKYWEAWNEPNLAQFYTGSATDYVRKVLVPFARAVRSADPSAKVVGGSAYGVSPAWWTEFGKAGGFGVVDVMSVHAYAWMSSYEATDTPAALKRLIALKDSMGGKGKPVWDTESAWKSSTANWGGPWTQADNVVRKLLWQRSLGIVSGQFLVEGGWEDWSVIDLFRGVKPAAMAMSTYDTLLSGRRFLGWAATGNAGVYAARFSARDASGVTVTAVWSGGAPRTIALKTRHQLHDSTGAPAIKELQLVATGAVQYLLAAPGQAAL